MTDNRIGNQWWKLRSKHGRDAIFANATKLEEACIEYFEWVEENPLLEERIFSTKNGISRGYVEKMRAMTIGGLCIFLDINQDTWCTWRKKKENGFSEVIKWADEIIRTQKFTGAAANMLNANIIARDLGLKEASDVSLKTEPEEDDDEYEDLSLLSVGELKEYERLKEKASGITEAD